MVLDPSGSQWDVDFSTTDTDEFIRAVFANERCLLIIDEAGEAIGRAQSAETEGRVKLATRTRHRGHSAIFIAQFATLVAPAVRRQCQKAWIFRQSYDDIKTLSRELCNPAVAQAAELPRGHCIYVTTFGEVQALDVFRLDGRRNIRLAHPA